MTAYDLRFTEDPAEFLDLAGEFLAADPLLNTVISSVTAAAAADDEAGRSERPYPRWWVTVHDSTDPAGPVVAVAMRTAPFAPYPMYVLPMAEKAAVQLARAAVERDEVVGGVNGALPAVRTVADEVARLVSGTVAEGEHVRLFELGDLVEPPLPPGRLRVATPADAELSLAWFRGFMAAAAEQVGRTAHAEPAEHFDETDIDRRIAGGGIWLWEDESSDVVHLTSFNPPAFGVARIGPVFTPAEHRGHGYASAAVAAVSRMLLDGGSRVCLFTDQANPTSNKIYEAVGYRPVVDMTNLVVTTPGPA